VLCQVHYLAGLPNLPTPVPEAAAKLAARAAAFRTQTCNLELIVNTHNDYQRCVGVVDTPFSPHLGAGLTYAMGGWPIGLSLSSALTKAIRQLESFNRT